MHHRLEANVTLLLYREDGIKKFFRNVVYCTIYLYTKFVLQNILAN